MSPLYVPGGSGGGAVDSVNGLSGVVVLDATDVDAGAIDGPNTWTGTQDFTGATVTGIDGGGGTLTDKGAWTTPTVYAVGDCVTENDQRYACAKPHTSGTFATDLAAGDWTALDSGAAVPLAQSGQTPAQEPVGSGWVSAVGSLAEAARADHVHPYSTNGDVRPPTGNLANFPRWGSISSGSLGSLATCSVLTFFTATHSGTFTQVRTWTSAATAGGTHAAIGLYSVSTDGLTLTLLGSSADTPTLWSASQIYTTPLQASVTVTVGSRYAFAFAWSGASGPAPWFYGLSIGNYATLGGAPPALYPGPVGDRFIASYLPTFTGTFQASLTDPTHIGGFGSYSCGPYTELVP
jgi:hypothetical protein